MTEKQKEYERVYTEFSKILRVWLSSYGVGFFAFVTTQKSILKSVSESDYDFGMVCFTLLGLMMQVGAAVMYKYTVAYLFKGEQTEGFKSSKRYRLAKWLDHAYEFEMAIDILTVAFYTIGLLFFIKIVL